ncbi:MAG TPA: succinate dehydrogenase iron-sulfur subunit [Chloroflexota bacterium]|nr:succinate dehydrogenase iron-sulfur subunit [Chloroflexota bacterium]
MQLTLRIQRFNPRRDERPYYREYTIEADAMERVLDALNTVKWEQDGTLTYRRSCGHGVCGSDAMRINGRNRLACKALVRDHAPRITIEPMLGFRVLKDLVVDMEPFFEKYRQIKPYLINDDEPGETERLQSPEERHRYDEGTKCILCGACTTACPPFWVNPGFLGPATLVNAHRFVFDSRDRAASQRLEALNSRNGVWRCRTVFNCTEACPRDIEITRLIEDLKRGLLFDKM